ncbi:uncharacterized protein LOC124930574 [Impatiens glandulifera]|uniref:uncharacterized protein LOC124930574 n=1 Tax=Impatiens glandulifera TaxID=253017 RepID=UPI001FB081C0|nr:uncharacterized protein LOC124930574 [Impatiens glandulifera]
MEGTEINWARSVFSNLMEMVRPASDRSWGYAVQLGKIFLHLKIKVGPGVGILKRSIIRSRHFLPRKQSASSSTEDEEWDDEEADTEGTENRTDHDGDNDERADDGNFNREEADEAEAERLAQNIFQGIIRRDEDVIDLYLEWHEYRFNTKYKDILSDHSQEHCIARLEEVEDNILRLTKSTPLVLEKLEKGKLEIRQEIERLEAICKQKQVPVYTAPVIEDFQTDWTTEDTVTPRDIETPLPENDEVPTSKTVEEQTLENVEVPISEVPVTNLEEAVTLETPTEVVDITDSGERADPDTTEQSPPTPPPEATVSVPPKEWIEDRLQEFEASVSERIGEQLKKFEVSTSGQMEDRLQKFEASISEMIDDRIVEHNVSKLQPFKDSADKIFDSAIKFADATKLVVDHTQTRLEQLSTGLWEEAGERENCAQHIVALEGLTSELKKDFERERLDAEVSRDKEAPRATQLTEEEVEAERIRRAESMYPGYAEQIARQAAADAERLETEQRRLAGFAKEHEKKKKAAASASAPTASASEPKKRKKPASKKVRIVEMLNIISDPVETGTSQQDDQVENELEEQLRYRSKRPRHST